MSFSQLIPSLFEDFILPKERLFWPVLLSSIAFAYLILRFQNKQSPWREIKESLLNKKIWLHQSSRTDLILFFTNNLLKLGFLILAAESLLNAQTLSIKLLSFLNQVFGEIKPLTTDWFWIKVSYTLVSFLLLDFFRFFFHYLMHKVQFLWYFHKVHHSATVLTPLTLNRMHPVEMFLGMGRTALATAIASALYVYIFQIPLNGIDILGVNLFGFLFNLAGANLRHSHLWLSFGQLEYVFISPAQHQIHHSRDPLHFNKNLGVCLSIWDQIFGSFMRLKSKPHNLEFGL